MESGFRQRGPIYKFVNPQLRRLSLTAAGADESFHDGNRFMAAKGEPLMLFHAAQVLEMKHTPISLVHSTIKLLQDKATHARLARVWGIDREIITSPKPGSLSNRVLSFAFCASIAAIWEDSGRSEETVIGIAQDILNVLQLEEPPGIGDSTMETGKANERTMYASFLEPTQTQDINPTTTILQIAPERGNTDNTVARPATDLVMSSPFLSASPASSRGIGQFDLLNFESATLYGSSNSRITPEQEVSLTPAFADVRKSVMGSIQAQSSSLALSPMPEAVSQDLNAHMILEFPISSPELSEYLHRGAYDSPSVAPEVGPSQPLPYSIPRSSSALSISRSPSTSLTRKSSRSQQTCGWTHQFVAREGLKISSFPSANESADIQTMRLVLGNVEKACHYKNIALLASTILPSSDSLLGFQRIISSYRRNLTSPFPSTSTTEARMFLRFREKREDMEHNILILRVLALRIYKKYWRSSESSSFRFVVNTDKTAYAHGRAGNPSNLAISDQSARIMDSIYPDLNPEDERYKELLRDIEHVRRLGEKLSVLTQAFGDQTGALAFLNPPPGKIAKTMAISDSYLVKCPAATFSKMVQILTGQSCTIMRFVDAATPIVEGVVDGTLKAEHVFLIETVNKDEIGKMLAGSAHLLRLLEKSVVY